MADVQRFSTFSSFYKNDICGIIKTVQLKNSDAYNIFSCPNIKIHNPVQWEGDIA